MSKPSDPEERESASLATTREYTVSDRGFIKISGKMRIGRADRRKRYAGSGKIDVEGGGRKKKMRRTRGIKLLVIKFCQRFV